jgi:hypothetical protein
MYACAPDLDFFTPLLRGCITEHRKSGGQLRLSAAVCRAL